MKPYVVNNSLRTISLLIDNDGSLSPFEDEVIQKYVSLHTFVFELLEQYKQWKKQGDAIRNNLQNRVAELDDFEKRMEEYNRFVRIVTEQEGLPEHTVNIKINPGQLTIDANVFQDDFNDVYTSLKEWVEAFEVLEKSYEKYNELLDEVDKKYVRYIYQNYNSVNIDLCSIDKDYDCFRETLSEIETLRDTTIDERDELVKEYDPVVKRVNGFYREVENFFYVFNNFQKLNNPGNENIELN